MRIFSFISILILCTASQANVIIPPPPQVDAGGYLLMDHHTGHIISEKNIDQRLAPASLTKIMTVYVVGKELEAGNISMNDEVTVSENAWAKNFPDSSKMFIEVNTKVKVSELMQGIMVQSGNDACVAIAEHIAGSESAFADMMNAHAARLGMSNSNFINSHGLHDPEHYTSPRDMAVLSSALISEMPDVYKTYSQREYTYNDIKQFNRNSLLWDKSINVDGIKTGHTSDAGYSLITSATQGDMRLISVVMGTDSERSRKTENKKQLRYGFRFFESVTPYTAGQSFVAHRIFMGDKDTVELGINVDTHITIPRGQSDQLTANFELANTLEAPIEKGIEVGTLRLMLADNTVATYPLVTLEEVKEGGLIDKAMDWARLQVGWDK